MTFALNETGSSTAKNFYNYSFTFTFVAPNVTAFEMQLGVSGINSTTGSDGPLPLYFNASLLSPLHVPRSLFDSRLSNWNGLSWNGSFATLGGWVSGSNVTLQPGDELVISTNQLLTWGPSAAIGALNAGASSWDDVLVVEMYAPSTGGAIQQVQF
jgi:hypothetical protein